MSYFLVSWCSLWFRAIWVVTNFPSDFGRRETAETVESLTQPEQLYSGLQNYTERQSQDRPGALLERMADQATALKLAEAATQDDGSAMAVKEGSVTAGGSTCTLAKN